MKHRDPDPLGLDEQTAELLLSGNLSPEEAPVGHARLAAVLAAAAAPPASREIEGARVAAAELAAVRRARPARRRIRMRNRIAVVGLTGALVVTGSLAAAGALPDAAQGVAQDVLQRIGIHVPGPNPNAGTHPFERGKSGKPKEHTPGQPANPSSNPNKPVGNEKSPSSNARQGGNSR